MNMARLWVEMRLEEYVMDNSRLAAYTESRGGHQELANEPVQLQTPDSGGLGRKELERRLSHPSGSSGVR